VCVLRESVDNYDDGVTAFGLGKALDEVHGEITPCMAAWNRQGLELACWVEVIVLGLLIVGTRSLPGRS
jgi:hypothetical protein